MGIDLAKYDDSSLLALYEEEIDRSGCFPYQEERTEWDESGWHAFAIRDEIARRLDERDRLRAALKRIAFPTRVSRGWPFDARYYAAHEIAMRVLADTPEAS